MFAKQLVAGKSIEYKGDPLLDFGLISFLDKFVAKNPRSTDRLKGGSIMQSLRKRNVVPVNPEELVLKNAEEVAGDEKFFYQYFKEKANNKKDTKVKKLDLDSEEEGVDEGDKFEDIEGGDDDDDGAIDEEAALFGSDISSDEEGGDKFDYDDLANDDFDEEDDDSEGDLLNDPTEDQLEELLLNDEELMGELEDEEPEEATAFAAAEEYAELLEDDVDEDTLAKFRSKHKIKDKSTKPKGPKSKLSKGMQTKTKASGNKNNNNNNKKKSTGGAATGGKRKRSFGKSGPKNKKSKFA